MNKLSYRIVFNKKRGCLMAVAETASSRGKAAQGERTRNASQVLPSDHCFSGLLRSAAFASLIMLGHPVFFSNSMQGMAYAQAIADLSAPSTQRPTVLAAPNGVPVVNIQTPSAAGVSRNTYSQFDVQRNGLILNNARDNVQTQLGGWVQGNPWLATGSARIIVNEVTSAKPSQLRGYIEVGGQRAEVIIANPAGVNIDGGGFINASRATITTGAPIINGGNLEGYVVQRGIVTINGQGLDASLTDYTGILARAVQVNAGIWAKDLQIFTGANQINAAQSSATATAATGSAPSFALDVAQLGGMYAGQIRLIGTEAGIGVRNSGVIAASAGEVQLSANGLLTNKNLISATGSATLATSGGIDNSGIIYSQQYTALSTQGNIVNSNLVAAQGNVSLTANGATSKIDNTSSSILVAGLQPDNSLGGSANLTVQATTQTNIQGRALATGNLAAQANALDLQSSEVSAQSVTIKARTQDINASAAKISANQTIDLQAAQTLRTDAATTNANELTITANALSNVAGTIIQTGSSDLSINLAGALDNSQGRIASNSTNLYVQSQSLRNTQGTIEHAGGGLLHIDTGALSGQSGTISSAATLKIDAAAMDHRQAKMGAQQITIQAASLDNSQANILAQGANAAQINITGQLNNSAGQIGSNGATQITAQNLINQGGTLQAANGQALTVQVSQLLDNSQQGNIAGSAATTLQTGSLNNTLGHITSATSLDITATQAVNNTQGLIASGGALTATAASLDNSRGTLASINGALTTTTTGITRNDSGRLQAAGTANLINAGLSNTAAATTPTQGGEIYASTLSIDTQSQSFNNQLGTVIASQAATLNTGILNNQSGLIQSTDALVINTHGQTLTNTEASKHASGAGGISSQASASITSGDFNNRAGFIGAAQTLSLTNNQITNTEQGQIASLTDLSLTASGFDNRGGSLQALGNLTVTASTGSVNNASLDGTTPGSIIRAGQTLSITAGSIINTNTLAANPASPTGSQGLEGNEVRLNAASINNQAGAIRANTNATLTSAGSINNSAGLISANQQSLLRDSDLANRNLGITNTSGTIIAGDLNSIQAASISGDGQLLSKNDLSINLTQNFANSSEINATRNVSMTSSADITNSGKLLAGNTLSINANNLNNQATGEISASTTRITAINTATNRGLIDGIDTQINANNLSNLGTGRIYGDNISIAAQILLSDKESAAAPVVAARQQLDIGAQTLTNREGALLFSAGNIAIAGGLDANRQATVGKTALLTNASATIEALGNITIQAGQVNNINNHFATQIVAIPGVQSLSEYRLDPGDVYRAGDIVTQHDASQVSVGPVNGCELGSCMIVNATGDTSDAHTRYDINRTVQESVVTASDPGRIIAGGQISLSMDNLLNDRSNIIAGGNLSATGGNINNTTVAGQRIITDSGTASSYYRVRQKGADAVGVDTVAYAPPDRIESITLNPTRFEANSAPAGTGTAINTRAIVNVTAALSAASAANASLAQASAPASATINPVTSVSTTGPLVVRTIAPNTTLPNNSLFRPAPATSGFLVETDPRFANYRDWLSSDYLLSALQIDPTTTQKRLGDGFYEQRLIREQIAQLTGQRFLGDYSSDETQYQALMSNALTFASAHNLRPGVALTQAQMTQLTSDIVWLVSQSVTLPDGRVVQALVPQVYLRTLPGDLSAAGGLMSGRNVALDLSGDMSNSGTVAGRQIVSLSANNVNNLSGRISGNAVSIKAATDINNIAGSITAASTLQLSAGRDINVASTTVSNTSQAGVNSFASTSINRVAGLYVTGVGADGKAVALPEGERPTLIASAGRDFNLQAAQVANTAAQGNVQLTAGNNLNLTTVTTSSSDSLIFSARNKQSSSQTQEVGSQIQASGNITLSAGQDVNAKAANVQAGGQLAIAAGRDISIEAGQDTNTQSSFLQTRRSGFLSSRTRTVDAKASTSEAIGSSLGGNTVILDAGRDLTVKGSSVIADKNVTLIADRDITLTAAQNTSSSESFREVKKSGLMGSGGFGVFIGSKTNSTDQKQQNVTQSGSTIGAITGDVTILAGNTAKVQASNILTPGSGNPFGGGDITILGKNVEITDLQNTSAQQTETKSRQSGLTVSLGGALVGAAEMAINTAKAISETKDSRAQALGAASAGLYLYNNAKAIGDAANAGQLLSSGPGSAANGPPEPGKQGVFDLSVSIGSSRSQSNSTSNSSTSVGSTLAAGGNITVAATGGGKDSNLLIQGSQIRADNNISLSADNAVTLQAGENTASSNSTSKSSSASIGASFGASGINVTASASKSRGNSDRSDISFTNTEVTAGNNLTITSGGSTALIGANPAGKAVNVDVGKTYSGDLTITSLQDKSTFTEKSRSSGGSISVGSAGVGGSINAGKSNINSNFESVSKQSGIAAGDAGFNVNVQGNTTLTGAVITSTQKAAHDGKNSFQSGSNVAITDINNTASYSANASNFSAGFSVGSDGKGGSKTTPSGSAGIGSASGNASSITVGGITGIAGNTTVLTGKDTTNALTPIFNQDTVRADVNAQVTITAQFGSNASKAWGTYATDQQNNAAANAQLASQSADGKYQGLTAGQWDEQSKCFQEGGNCRAAGHAVIGGLTGGGGGALGASTVSIAAPVLNELQSKASTLLQNAGVSPALADGLSGMFSSATAMTLGGITGGTAGAVAAANADINNRQLVYNSRPNVLTWARSNAQRAGMSADELYFASMLALGDYFDENGRARPGFENVTYDQYMTARNLLLREPVNSSLAREIALAERTVIPQFATLDEGRGPNFSRIGAGSQIVLNGVNTTIDRVRTLSNGTREALDSRGNVVVRITDAELLDNTGRVIARLDTQTNTWQTVSTTQLGTNAPPLLISGPGAWPSASQPVASGVAIASTTRATSIFGPGGASGPLPPNIANTFRSGTYVETITVAPTTLYRVYGGTANQLGGYWTTTPPAGPVQSIVDSALNPAWGNPATSVVRIEVPPGVTLYQGQTVAQGGLVGGGNQVLFPINVTINPEWIRP